MKLTNLRAMRLERNSRICLLRSCGAGVRFEVRYHDTPVLIFQFSDGNPQKIKPLFDAFQSCSPMNPIETEQVSAFPPLPMCRVNCGFGDCLLWACPEIYLQLVEHTGCASIEIGINNGCCQVASVDFPGRTCEDEGLLDFALSLRKLFGMRRQVRVESSFRRKTISWYIPPAV